MIVIGLANVFLGRYERTRNVARNLSGVWGRTIISAHPCWHLTMEGTENLPREGGYILTSNHNSLVDIFAMFFLPSPFRWVSKESLFRVPFLGCAMKWSGHIRLLRDERRSIRHTFGAMLKCLRKGDPVALFPEGTRSRDGELGPFKAGAFRLAIKAGVPIVPVVITGTRDVVVPGTWILKFQKGKWDVRMQVFPPIPPPPDGPGAADQLSDEVRQVIARALGQADPPPAH